MSLRSLILIVEDNPADSHLIKTALHERHPNADVQLVESGTGASDYLFRRGHFRESVLPDLVLLDLNLPGKSGVEVLREVKQDPRLKSIPVVMFTSSEAPNDIQSSYDAGANAYFAKPNELKDFFKTIDLIYEHWVGLAKLPPSTRKN